MSDLFHFDAIEGGYGDTQIVFSISGALSNGEVLGVFGRNGVGKTTLSKLLVGALPVLAGKISLEGEDLTLLAQHARRHKGIGYMPQTSMVFDNLTVEENLSLAESDTARDFYFDMFPRLAQRLDQLAGSMSGGERKILSFVRTMLEETSLIVLDEPSEGVQPENIEKMQQCIKARRGDGTSFILVEQNLNMLMSVSDRYLGIESGRTVFERQRTDATRDDLVDVLTV